MQSLQLAIAAALLAQLLPLLLYSNFGRSILIVASADPTSTLGAPLHPREDANFTLERFAASFASADVLLLAALLVVPKYGALVSALGGGLLGRRRRRRAGARGAR